MLLWTFIYKILRGHMFSFFLNICHIVVKICGHMVTMQTFSRIFFISVAILSSLFSFCLFHCVHLFFSISQCEYAPKFWAMTLPFSSFSLSALYKTPFTWATYLSLTFRNLLSAWSFSTYRCVLLLLINSCQHHLLWKAWTYSFPILL